MCTRNTSKNRYLLGFELKEIWVVAGDLDSSKLSTADCLSSFVLQNSVAGPAREGLQLSNSRGQHLAYSVNNSRAADLMLH